MQLQKGNFAAIMKCIVIDPVHPILLEGLENLGITVSYLPQIKPAEVAQQLHDSQGLVLRSKVVVNAALLAHGPELKFVARAGSGLDGIDSQALNQSGIELFSAPEGNRDAVAEHSLGLLLALFNKIPLADRLVRSGQWAREQCRGLEIKGKTLGIVGYGNMGSALALRLSGFGCRVLSYDKQNKKDNNTLSVSLQELKDQADIVSLHIPLNPENRGLFNREYISGFAKNFFLINTSRGEVLPLKDLVWGLESGKILGAGLDVLENENFANFSPDQAALFDKLSQMPNVVLSPHVAGWTQESYQKISEVLVEKISHWIEKSKS
jgi:D-3-phosphoglycerate dehydrogenase